MKAESDKLSVKANSIIMDNSEIDISVIVVCYNQAGTIARTLDSILEQTEAGKIEIIVNDDHSTDRTGEIILDYQARYPKIISCFIQPKNLGVQGNYFHALRRCKGKYIADCAGDDWWCDPLKLSKEKKILDQNPNVTLVHTSWNYAYPDGTFSEFCRIENNNEGIYSGKAILESILCGKNNPEIHLCTALYRKDYAIQALNSDLDIFLNPEYKCEDLQIEAAMAAAGDISYIPDITLNYSVGRKSISSAETFTKAFDFYFHATILIMSLLKKYNISKDLSNKAIATRINYLAAQAFYSGSKSRITKLEQLIIENKLPRPLKSRLYLCLYHSPLRGLVKTIRKK